MGNGTDLEGRGLGDGSYVVSHREEKGRLGQIETHERVKRFRLRLQTSL